MKGRLQRAWIASVLLAASAGCSDEGDARSPDAAGSRDGETDGQTSAPVTPDAQVPREDAALPPDGGGDPDSGDDEDAGGEPDADSGPRGRIELVDPALWREVAASADDWDDRPSDAACDPLGYGVEDLGGLTAFFVNTARCGYMTARQPSLAEVRAGDELRVRLWYFDLYGPDGAEAHAVVRIGDLVVLEERIALPAPGDLVRRPLIVDAPIPAGTPVELHVHNHGANEYAVLEVSTGPPEE